MNALLRRIIQAPMMLMMGNIGSLSNREKWEKAIEDGEKAVFGEGDPAPKPEPAPEPEPKPTPEPEPQPQPKPEPAGNQAELDALKQENARLTAQIADENGTYKARYLTLQGMFSKANEEIKTLKEQLAEAKVAKPAAPAPVPAAPVSLEDDPDYQALVAELGEKGAKAAMAITSKRQAETAASTAALQKELDALKDQVQTTASRTETVEQTAGTLAQDRFFTSLTAAVPDWKELNGWDGKPMDPKFSAFLDQTAPGTNHTYDQLLSSNYSQGNVNAIAEIFHLFKEKNPATAAEPPAPKPDLEDHLDVGKTGKGGKAPLEKDKKPIIPKSEADAFYRNYRSLKATKTPDELAKMEAVYTDAANEGRINFNA